MIKGKDDIDNGGPAFPFAYDTNNEFCHRGMTLRDYFAGQAIMGYLPGTSVSKNDIEFMAQRAYVIADAMIKARK